MIGMPRRLSSTDPDFESRLTALLAYDHDTDDAVQATVAAMNRWPLFLLTLLAGLAWAALRIQVPAPIDADAPASQG
jgi:hypothetical protein